MDTQKVVLIDTANANDTTKLLDITKELLDHEDTPQPIHQSQQYNSYLWHVDTKYYTADVHLTPIKEKSIIDRNFSESVEAVVIYFNSSKDVNGLKEVESWASFLDVWQPGIKLIVCEKCDREGDRTLSRVSVQEWCLDNDFELVELDPDMEDYDEFEDVGIKRIRNALSAHMWPDMTMKNSENVVKKIPPSCGVAAAKEPSTVPQVTPEGIDGLLGGADFDDILEDEGDFEKLFSKMHVLKEKARGLPDSERKKYAENVVKAFWSALGGDKEELEGLSSEED